MTPTRTRSSQQFTLRLECLEDRAVPATFNVTTTLDVIDPADGKRSLREAVTASNNLAGADVIVLPAGVFKLALAGAGEDANASGDLDVTGAVTVRGAGAGLTIIDGRVLDRVFDVFGTAPGSIAVVLEKLTVRNGSVVGHGGGVQVVDANLVVRDSAVNGNRASGTGGGVSNGSSAGTGDVRVVRTTLARNVAGTNGGGLGVFGSSLLTVKDSTVRRNVASSIGGGIASNTATLTNCTVSANTTATDGGGIFAGTATLTNCTVSGNSASGAGGGINASTMTVTNSTVSGNTAATDGGGIWADFATLLNCTVVENSAHTGGGVFHLVGGGGFNVRNTIIALNLVDFTGTQPDVFGLFISQGHNLIGNVANNLSFGINGDIVGSAANPIDPRLGALKNNGGKTKTHALLAGSRAIDAGDNANVPSTDQRGIGFARKKDGNFNGVAIVDIGAFER